GLWGLAPGLGTRAGPGRAGSLDAADWRSPFRALTLAGRAATLANLCTARLSRVAREPARHELHAAGGEAARRSGRACRPRIAARRTNWWLVSQGPTAQLAFGSLVWLPRRFQAKVEDLGYAGETAIIVGSVFTVLIFAGGALSLVRAMVGDRVQRRTPRGRAM